MKRSMLSLPLPSVCYRYLGSFLSSVIACLACITCQAQVQRWSTQSIAIDTDPASWARMAKLQDGSWLAAYAVWPGPDTHSHIRVKRSFDDMRTWQLIADIAEDGRDIDNANLWTSPDGTVRLAMRSVITAQSYRINVYSSHDMGNSWSYLSTADANEGGKYGGLWEPFLLGLPDGSLAIFYADETHSGYSQLLGERISSDGGATWGDERIAVGVPGGSRPGEPNVSRTADGFSLFYEVCGTENCTGHVSTSPDGITWTGRLGTTIPLTWQDAQGVALEDGAVLVTSNEHAVVDLSGKSTGNPFTFGSWPALYQVGRDLAIVMSGAGDEGQNGIYVRFGSLTQEHTMSRVK